MVWRERQRLTLKAVYSLSPTRVPGGINKGRGGAVDVSLASPCCNIYKGKHLAYPGLGAGIDQWLEHRTRD